MAAQIRLDSAGIEEVLRSAKTRGLIEGLGNAVAADVVAIPSDGEPAEVDSLVVVTDRAKALVTIMHPAGLRIEAKHGVLAGAAARNGLTVKAKEV